MPDVAVVTTVHGRLAHLAGLRRGLSRQDTPCEHIVVQMGGPDPCSALTGGVPTRVVDMPVAVGHPLPLAAARNAGASVTCADLLVFLDVDCIPSAGLVGRYRDAGRVQDGLLAGAVAYLPNGIDPTGLDDNALAAAAHQHPARPSVPEDGLLPESRYELFWSLSFAVRRELFETLGGFCEDYVGYGGEDTDLAFTARAAGVPLTWVGGAQAWHQYHATEDPPRQHLHDIVTNSRLFFRRWGRWPMEGWLRAFAAEGVIDWQPDGLELREVER